MLAAEHRVARRGKFLADNARGLHVARNNGLRLLPADRRVDGLGGTLGHVAHAVELGALAAVPHGAELGKFVRDDRVGAAHAGKSGSLAEAPKLDGAGAGPRNLEDGMREAFVLDIAVVGAVEEYYRAVLVRVVHKLLERLAAEHRTRRVVRAAQVNHLHRVLGQVRLEVVFRCRCKVGDLRKMSVILQHAGTPCHHVRVQIDRIDRVRDGDFYIFCKKFLDVRHIALGTVTHEDIVRIHLDTAGGVLARDNRLAQKVVALLGPVPAETPLLGHLVDSLVHGLDDFGNERSGHVADTQAHDVGIGLLCLVFGNFLGDGRKQVATRQQVVVCI